MARGGEGDGPEAAGGAAEAGARLRAAREGRGLSVAEVANEIRVSSRHILAIEDGRLDSLPEGPYRRGFVEAFAALVGLDPRETFALIDGGARGGDDRTVFLYPLRGRFNWRDWTIPIALAAGLAAFGLVRELGREDAVLPSPPTAPAAGLPELPAHPALAGEEAVPPPGGHAEPGSEAVRDAGVQVLLRSEGTTWVLAAADGGREQRHELGPGENLLLTARERLGLTVGDAGVVRIRDGSRELGFVGERGETRQGMLFTVRREPAAAPRESGD